MEINRKIFKHDIDIGKIPPQNIQSEEAVLGAILLEDDAYNKISNLLASKMFYKEEHKEIFLTIISLINQDKPIDLIIVTEELKKRKKLEEIGGAFYITNLTNGIGSSANIEYHARIIVEKYMLREVIRICSDSVNDAYEEKDPFNLIDYVQDEVSKLDIDYLENFFEDAFEAAIDEIISKKSEEVIRYYKTGFKRFDDIVHIDFNRIMYIISGTKMGKTKFVINIVKRLLLAYTNLGVYWHTYEMPAKDIVHNMISEEMFLTINQLQSIDYDLSDKQIEGIKNCSTKYKNFDIKFEQQPQDIGSIKKQFTKFAKQMKAKGKKPILIIDNRKLMTRTKRTLVDDDDYVAKELVKLRDKTNGLIIILHHLKKSYLETLTAEQAYRPSLEYAYGGTALSDFANQVILLNKTDMFDDLVEQEKKIRPDMSDSTGHFIEKLLIVDIAINRNGKNGIVRFFHELGYDKFTEWK